MILKRSWTAAGGHRRDFILGCPLAGAALLSCKVQPDRWIAPHLAVRALFDYGRWESWVTQPVHCTPLWPASWLLVVGKSRSSKSAEVQRVWEVYDERLQFMSHRDASLLDESLDRDDVSLAWAVWSQAAESALADAFSLVVVLFPLEVWFLAGVLLCFVGFSWVVIGFVGLELTLLTLLMLLIIFFRDFSIAPLLDMRRRFKAVMDLLDALIRYGVSLSRSVELTAQWNLIIALGPMYPVTLDDLSVGHSLMLLLVFIAAVVMKQFEGGVIGFGRIPWFILIVGFVLIWCRLLPFFSVTLVLLLGVLVFFLILIRLMQNSERLGFPIFAALGKGRPTLTNSALKLMGGCRFFPEVHLPG